MRKIFIALLVLTALLVLAACGSKPETTAKAFLSALEKMDFEAAKKHATKDSQELLTMAQSFVSSMPAEKKGDIEKKKFNITGTKIDGDTAVVTFEEWEEKTPDAKKTNELKMVKEDGKWKVKVEKGGMGK